MTIKKVIALEENNKNCVYLIKEGYFWRCYEKSAYLFIKYIKNFQIIKRYIKSIDKEICYLGFPENLFGVIIEPLVKNGKFKVTKKSDNIVIIENFQDLSEELFLEWKQSIKLPDEKAAEKNEIIRKIKMFPVMEKTPLECMQFIIEIQKRLKLLENGEI